MSLARMLLVMALYLAPGVYDAWALDHFAVNRPLDSPWNSHRALRFVFFALLWLPIDLALGAYRVYERLRG